MMVDKVLIFGHSFVHRLESFVNTNRSTGWFNLGLDGTDIQVEFYGLGGGTLRPGPKSIQRRKHLSVISSYQPSSMFLQICGNDINAYTDTDKLARDAVSFADFLLTGYDLRHVVLGQLLPRFSSGSWYNEKVCEVNNSIAKLLEGKPHITFWHHRGLWKNAHSLIGTDRVHLTDDEGMLIYAKSVRAAIGSFKRRK